MSQIEKKVEDTIKRFSLASKKDRIFVAVSGGKDSTVALHIMSSLFPFVEAITIDALIGNYSKENLVNIKDFCKKRRIRLHVVSFREEFGYSLCYIQSILRSKGLKMKSCAICGVLKRYLLNKKSRELKADVLVTGHNMDDESQSILMNLLRGNPSMLANLGPKTGINIDSKFVSRIKPLYFVSEKTIANFSKKMDFPVKYGRCPCSSDSYRNSVRTLLNDYEKLHPGLKKNIVDFFIKIMPRLKQIPGLKKLSYCSVCAEPSQNSCCKACEIIAKMHKS